MNLAYYITSHGYGHGVRSIDLLNAFHEQYPETDILLITELPDLFLQSRLKFKPELIRRASFDVGMIQLDSVRVDLNATRDRLIELDAAWDALLESEQQWLTEQGVAMVVSDIPAIPLEAAAKLGLPCLGFGNFTWSWIYEEFLDHDPVWEKVVGRFKQGYGEATALMRLPFSESMDAFNKIIDVPLVAGAGEDIKAAIAETTSADTNKKWVLLSFTTLELYEGAADKIADLDEFEFFTILPLRLKSGKIHVIDPSQHAVKDLFSSMDVVITKPGFGILCDCCVNDLPMIYVEREHFREYPILEVSIKKHLKHVHLPAEDLYKGEVLNALRAIAKAPEAPEPLKGDAGLIASRTIRDYL